MQRESIHMEKHIEEAVKWIREHQERFWGISGTTLLALLFIILLVHHHDTENEEAWTQLGGIQRLLAQNKWEEARKGLETWNTRFQGSNGATYAKFLKAVLVYRTSN